MEIKFDGVAMKLGGKEIVVPPLSLKLIRKYQEELKNIGNFSGVPGPEQIDLISKVILDAIQRNYPDFTMDELEEVIDVKNMRTLFQAIMGVSGLEATPAKE
jgi:hypothetical protein